MLNDYIKYYDGKLEVLTSNENIGSAGGYALGLHAAIEASHEYLWLLDDDNLPQKNSLSSLLDAYLIYSGKMRKEELVLQSLRESLPEMLEILTNNRPQALPRPSSFIGFHVFNLLDFLFSKLFMNIQKDNLNLSHRQKFIRLHFAPYGGLFFHRDAIKMIGLPNPLFFLYADDFAYTLNFTIQGGSLFLVTDSRIMDLEPVWNSVGERTSNLYRRLKVLSSSKTYYEVRNRIYLDRMLFPGHPIMYFINKWLYIIILGVFSLFYFCGARFKLIMRAINDGENGHLGRREFGSD